MILSFFKRPTVDVEDIWRHNGEVSSFLLTALIIVVGWNCAGKYYNELPDNLQRFLCNILYVSIGWVNRFSALIVFQLIKFYRYSPVSLEKLSKASHSKLLPLWKFLNFLGLQMISCTLSRMQNQLESIFCIDRIPIEMVSCYPPLFLSPPCIKRQLDSLWLFPSKYCAYNSSSFCLEMGRSEALSGLSRFLLFALPFWLKCLMSCVGELEPFFVVCQTEVAWLWRQSWILKNGGQN